MSDLVTLGVCPDHGPVALRSITCPVPVNAGDKSDPQATNPCAKKLALREYAPVVG